MSCEPDGSATAVVLDRVELADELGRRAVGGQRVAPQLLGDDAGPGGHPAAVHVPDRGLHARPPPSTRAARGWPPRRTAGRSSRPPSAAGTGTCRWRPPKARPAPGPAAVGAVIGASPRRRACRPCGRRTARRSSSYVSAMPSRSGVSGSQPRTSWMKVLSLLRPATPLGASRSYSRSSFTPAMSSTMTTSSLIETSSLEPRLMGVAMRSGLCMMRSMPWRQSSM